MKKIFTALFLTSFLATAAFADANVNSGYFSTQHPAAKTASPAAAKALVPPTDITITNASNSVIFASVPNSPVYDMIYSGTNDHIRHNSYFGDTHIVLSDPNHNVFFDSYVCRLAVMTVYGYPGAYRINVDKEYCY